MVSEEKGEVLENKRIANMKMSDFQYELNKEIFDMLIASGSD